MRMEEVFSSAMSRMDIYILIAGVHHAYSAISFIGPATESKEMRILQRVPWG